MSLRFMPGYYVFPGGTVDEGDVAVSQDLPLHAATESGLSRHAVPELHRALAWAAIRETWEETGLMFGTPAPWGPEPGRCEGAEAFRRHGLHPGSARVEFFARAITPAASPIRFDSRFFLADGTDIHGDIAPSGELEDVAWHRADFAVAAYPMAHVSRFMLARAMSIWSGSVGEHTPTERPIARFTQQGERFSMHEDEPAVHPRSTRTGWTGLRARRCLTLVGNCLSSRIFRRTSGRRGRQRRLSRR